MQQSRNNKFDQQVKNTLENASVEPPAFLWNTIENKLPSDKNWYSKYKYLLLLLLLSFTSASSIFVYKNFVLKNNTSDIALNKRLLKDETKGNENQLESANKNLSALSVDESNANGTDNNSSVNTENIADNNSNKTTVSSFYKTENNGAGNTAALFAQKKSLEESERTERLKRLEVKPENQESEIKNQEEIAKLTQKNNLPKTVAIVTPDVILKNQKTKKIKQYSPDNSIKNSVAAVTDNSTIETEDITKPINEPIRNIPSEPLTVSIVPVKVQQSPIPSRDVLRSLIAPEKLEKLDIESQAAGINDLNPNKEKMLKNLKQFAGYDINKGFHIGAFISINNVWLNKKQFSADENTSSIKPKVQFGKAYGLTIGYDYTDRWGIELEWQISEQGQKYSITQLKDDDKHTKDVNLMYTKFPLMLKYKHMFINSYNSKPIALSFLFGPQFSALIKQHVQLDGKNVNDAPQYNKAEFGVAGGFDFDLFMTRNLALTIGGRTGFGTSFKKGQPMSFQLGVTTQLNFRFPKKIK